MYYANTNYKKVATVIVISDKVNFRIRKISKDKVQNARRVNLPKEDKYPQCIHLETEVQNTCSKVERTEGEILKIQLCLEFFSFQ